MSRDPQPAEEGTGDLHCDIATVTLLLSTNHVAGPPGCVHVCMCVCGGGGPGPTEGPAFLELPSSWERSGCHHVTRWSGREAELTW